MKLFEDLKRVTTILSRWPNTWAICGGIAASIYRDTPRFTADIDIMLIDSQDQTATEIATSAARALNFKPIDGWITDQNGNLIKEQALVSCRNDEKGSYIGIDFILPIMPWVSESVLRAQHNKLDFGFDFLPTITTEDLIIAKIYAYSGQPSRLLDLDDIKALLNSKIEINKNYIEAQIKRYNLSFNISDI